MQYGRSLNTKRKAACPVRRYAVAFNGTWQLRRKEVVQPSSGSMSLAPRSSLDKDKESGVSLLMVVKSCEDKAKAD